VGGYFLMWATFWENIQKFFKESLAADWPLYILEFVLFFAVFFYVFKVLKSNKADIFIYATVICILFGGFTFALAASQGKIDQGIFVLIILMGALLVFTMFNTEIKRSLFGLHVKKRKGDHLTVSGVESVIEETVRAVQNMSKKDVGALIVLSDDNLPEGIIESGTVINADITTQMIEAVFYPKAPLHDGALIIEGTKLYAAGCFLPIVQDENLPKDMGSRHRAALGVTMVANVTAIVVSEETGIISIVKNGAVKKKYADAADLKNALSDYYWSDLSAEGKL